MSKTNKIDYMNKYICTISTALFLSVIVSLSSSADERETHPDKRLKVEIISLKDNERVHGNITIEARVNDPEAVKYCEFYIQEPGAADRYSWMAYESPYVWGGKGQTLDTTMFDDGPSSAVAFCFPKRKDAPMVQHRVHFVIDNGMPKVKILSLKDGEVANRNVTIKADARDPKGIGKGIISVSFYLDGGLLQRLTRPPFQTELDICLLTPGLHSIRAVAENSERLIAADAIIIRVDGGSTALKNRLK